MENIFLDIFTSFWNIVFFILRAFVPAIIGLFLAYLMSGPSEWIRIKLFDSQDQLLGSTPPKGRVVSILIAYLLLIVILFSVAGAFVILIIGTIPTDDLADTAKKVYDYFSSIEPLKNWFDEFFSLESLAQFASTIISTAVNVFVGIVASIYLIKDKEFFITLWQKLLSLLLKQKIHGQINEIISEIHVVLTTFLKGAFIDGMIIALLSSVLLSALNVKFAVLIGILAGIVNIIPYFGPFIGMVPALLMAYLSGGLLRSIVVLVALLAVQQLDSNYIYPKVVGRSIGLHPFFVLISVTVFGRFGGILGMLLAVPAAGIIQVLIKKWAYSK
ncbi:MAG: AI-2E family transporter [Firmicutes bacterium]|nr:AI-2E family transporter [Bacillota bacterium]